MPGTPYDPQQAQQNNQLTTWGENQFAGDPVGQQLFQKLAQNGAFGNVGGPNGNGGNPLSDVTSVDASDTDPSQTAAGQYTINTQAGSQAAQKQAYDQTAALAQGKGPSLATQLLNQQAAQAMGNQNAMASSAQGSQSALARRQAMMANAGTMQNLGSQGATARAQEQLGAMQMQGQQAGQMRAQDQTLAAQGLQSTYNQAGLNLGHYGVDRGVQVANQQQAIQVGEDVAKGVGSAAMAADMHLSEPGGGAHWIIREEPNFLLAANARTGEFRKILTAPLSPEEHQQAMKKHGAGPVGSAHPGNKYYGDLDLSNPGASQMAPPDPGQMPQAPQMGGQQGPQQGPPPNPQQPMEARTAQYNQASQAMPTNTTPSPSYADGWDDKIKQRHQQEAANQEAELAQKRQKATQLLESMGKGGPQAPSLPQFFQPQAQKFSFDSGANGGQGGSGDNQAADVVLGGSPPPAPAQADVQPTSPPQVRHGSDQVQAPAPKTDIRLEGSNVRGKSGPQLYSNFGSSGQARDLGLSRPGESGGYGLGARQGLNDLKMNPLSVDYSKADTATLNSMVENDQTHTDPSTGQPYWPPGDVDLGEYRAALKQAVDSQRIERGLPPFDPTAAAVGWKNPKFWTKNADPQGAVSIPDSTNDTHIGDAAKALMPDFAPDEETSDGHYEMGDDSLANDPKRVNVRERTIEAAPPKKKEAPKPPVRNDPQMKSLKKPHPEAVAADLHLGGRSALSKKFRTPGIKSPGVAVPKFDLAKPAPLVKKFGSRRT